MRDINQKADQLGRVVEKLTRMLANKGIKVTQRGVQAYCEFDRTTGKVKRINIPVIPPNPSEAFINALHGFIDHEVAHALFTDPRQERRVAEASTLKISSEQRHGMVNIVDDVRIENLMAEEFRGSLENMEATRIFVQDTMWGPELDKLNRSNPAEEQVARTIALVPYLRALGGHRACQIFVDKYNLAPLFAELIKQMPDLERRLKRLRTSTEVAQLADELLRIMRPPPAPPQPKQPPPPKQEPQDRDDPDEGESEGEGGKPPPKDEEDGSDEQSEGEDKDQEGEGAGGGEDETDSEKHEADEDAPEDDTPDDHETDGEADEDREKGDKQKGAHSADDDDSYDAEDEEDGDEEEGSEGGKEQDDTEREGGGSGDADEDDCAGEDEDDEEGEGSDGGPGSEDEDGNEKTDGDEGADGEDGRPGEAGVGDDEAGDQEFGNENPGQEETNATGGRPEEGEQAPPQPMEIDLDALQDMDSALAEALKAALSTAFDGTVQTDFSRDFDVIEEAPSDGVTDTSAFEDAVKKMTGPMQKELQRIMVARSQSFNVGGYRSGRINGPALHRVFAGDDRAFKRKVEAKSNQVAVTLLCDISGSMRGPSLQMALMSAWAFSSVLDKLKIPNEIIGFTTTNFTKSGVASHQQHQIAAEIEQMYRDTGLPRGSIRTTPVWMPIYKAFGENFGVEQKKRLTRMMQTQQGMGSNNDAQALQVAGERLMQRQEKRKILIVFSDGQPTCGSVLPWIIGASMKAIIARFQKQGIETIGVGILDDTVRQFYPKHFVLDKLANLPKLVMTELKALLVGG